MKIILALVAIVLILAILDIIDVQSLLHDAINAVSEILKSLLGGAS